MKKLKKNYLKDTSNSSLEREVKEAFKCTIACDYMELLANSLRPTKLRDIVGEDHLVGKDGNQP